MDKLMATDPAHAAVLYESFLAGCHGKAGELDDSSGSFGQFAQTLICRWIRARQAAGADPDKIAPPLPGVDGRRPLCVLPRNREGRCGV
jgi:hypothetical protein